MNLNINIKYVLLIDGNMHLNICVNKDGSNLDKMVNILDPFVYDYVR